MSDFKIDATDLRILKILQEDACISNLELAEKVALSPSPCSRRVRILQDEGFFSGRATLLNSDVIGLPVNVFVQITLLRQKKKNLVGFEEAIMQRPEIMECYLMTGDFDYLIRVAVPNLAAYQIFLDDLTQVEEIDHIKSSFSLKQIQYKTAFPLDHLL